MKLYDRAKFWNTTPTERTASYPCDRYLDNPTEGYVRAIDVEAPPEVLFRWLCQLKIAPYSYDWIDNGGRQSPRQLTPGTDQLERGQHFLVFELADFEVNHHLSGVVRPEFERIYGPLAVSYVIQPSSEQMCRLVAKLNVGISSGVWKRVRRVLLAWGDFVMTRKQLLTLKAHAERHVAE